MVAPDYAADLSIPILDHGRNAKRKEDRLLDHVQCTCTILRVSTYLLLLYKRIFFRIRLEVHNNNFSFGREKNKKYILVKVEKS